ncbi:MAG TPA: helix-turn-helix transcriptional regulator [Marmoricola sp.]|nr:helix-turn-helix transcriptional regulator [Marmoricola sp.]
MSAQLSLRQLADQTGVSNPYLSQIERGLRRPSAEVLQQIAKALRISAEQLYVQAGILNPEEGQVRSVELAILADPALTERQKNTLLDVYQSFRAATEAAHPAVSATDMDDIAGGATVSEIHPQDDLVAPAAQAEQGDTNG